MSLQSRVCSCTPIMSRRCGLATVETLRWCSLTNEVSAAKLIGVGIEDRAATTTNIVGSVSKNHQQSNTAWDREAKVEILGRSEQISWLKIVQGRVPLRHFSIECALRHPTRQSISISNFWYYCPSPTLLQARLNNVAQVSKVRNIKPR